MRNPMWETYRGDDPLPDGVAYWIVYLEGRSVTDARNDGAGSRGVHLWAAEGPPVFRHYYIADLPPGRYRVKLEGRDDGGRTVAGAFVEFVEVIEAEPVEVPVAEPAGVDGSTAVLLEALRRSERTVAAAMDHCRQTSREMTATMGQLHASNVTILTACHAQQTEALGQIAAAGATVRIAEAEAFAPREATTPAGPAGLTLDTMVGYVERLAPLAAGAYATLNAGGKLDGLVGVLKGAVTGENGGGAALERIVGKFAETYQEVARIRLEGDLIKQGAIGVDEAANDDAEPTDPAALAG